MPIQIPGVDYSHHGFTGSQLKANNIAFACRYIQNFPGSSLDKEMKATELASLSGAGIRVVANWEWSANPPNDRAVGKDHATKAKARLASLSVPDWAPVYYSIDVGLQADSRTAYAQGWRDVYPADQLGVYTCGALFRQLKADGFVKYAWQSMSRSFPGNHLVGQPDIWDHRGADIVQTRSGSLLTKALDFDYATVEDYGGFLMGEENPSMALTSTDITNIVNGVWGAKLANGTTAGGNIVETHDRNEELYGDYRDKDALIAAIASAVVTALPPGTSLELDAADLAAIAKAVNDDAATRRENWK